MAPVLRCIADTRCSIGENPLWHPGEQALYWCDIPNGRLHRYDWPGGPACIVRDPGAEGGALGGFTLEQDGALLLFLDRGRISRWQHGHETIVQAGIERERDSRFNDVIAAPDGRVFCGTMSTQTQAGRIYRLGPGPVLEVVMEEIACPNGMAFSLDSRLLYLTDSFARTVFVTPYDPETGTAGQAEISLETADEDGFPDGLTMDAEGYLWQARWGGGCVVRISPEGREVLRIDVPTSKVASITIGGPNLQTLFITTAGGDNRPVESPLAGAVFALDLELAGRPEYRSRIALF